MEERILEVAKKLFLYHGVKVITMDDLAQTIGISKKTLYSFFKDKNQLVELITRDFIKRHTEVIVKCALTAEDAIHEHKLMLQRTEELLSDVKPDLAYELKKFFPEVYALLLEHANTFVFESIVANVDRGIKEGLFRQHLNTNLIASLRLSQLSPLIISSGCFFENKLVKAYRYAVAELYLYSITQPQHQNFISYYFEGTGNY